MSWTAPRTWVAGETVTAALLNTHLRDNLLAQAGVVAATSSSNTTATSTGATEALHAGLAISPTTIESGRYYWIDVFGRAGYSAATGVVGVRVHASQSAITTGSPTVAQGNVRCEVAAPNGAYDLPVVRYLWTPGAAGTWNLQVGVVSVVGAGNASFGLGAVNATLTLTTAL